MFDWWLPFFVDCCWLWATGHLRSHTHSKKFNHFFPFGVFGLIYSLLKRRPAQPLISFLFNNWIVLVIELINVWWKEEGMDGSWAQTYNQQLRRLNESISFNRASSSINPFLPFHQTQRKTNKFIFLLIWFNESNLLISLDWIERIL